MKTFYLFTSLIFIIMILALQGHAKIDTKSLVGAWLFDEGGGNIARDSSGKGNNGTLKNDPSWITGKFGKALEFDGKDDFVEIPDHDTLDVAIITLTTWVKGKANQLIDGNVIIYKLSSYIHQYWSSTINPGVFVGKNWCGSGWLPKGVIWDGEWHHIALTYDGSIQKFYVDGVFAGENSVCKGNIDITDNSIKIGTGNVGFYTGSIDEVAIFNVVLEGDDLKNLVDKGLRDITAVFPNEKLSTTWGNIKGILYLFTSSK